MNESAPPKIPLRRAATLAVASTITSLLVGVGAAGAAVTTFGSPLDVPATLNTAEHLNYTGSNIALPGSVFHIPHDGADTALWNVAIPNGAPTSPVTGQVSEFKLEGCAEQREGVAPLTQFHFQALTPTEDGGAQIDISSGAFDIPVCGTGASGSTVTSYQPFNFCVGTGDYVAFNDEGGFVPNNSGPPPYPAGVPYKVIGAVRSARMDSFIRDGGTNNGTKMSPSDVSYHDGFASNQNEELLLQATVGTGPDASPSCGGTKGSGYGSGPGKPKVDLPPLRIGPQTDGINHKRISAIAMYCRVKTGCKGTLAFAPAKKADSSRAHRFQVNFSIRGGTTVHLPVRVPQGIIRLARKRKSGVQMALSAAVGGQTITQKIVLRIF